MITRKLTALVAASLVFSTSPAAAQVGPNPSAPPPGSTPPPTSNAPGRADEDRGNGIFRSDLTFMLVAIGVAVLIAFLATQIEGDDAEQPVTP